MNYYTTMKYWLCINIPNELIDHFWRTVSHCACGNRTTMCTFNATTVTFCQLIEYETNCSSTRQPSYTVGGTPCVCTKYSSLPSTTRAPWVERRRHEFLAKHIYTPTPTIQHIYIYIYVYMYISNTFHITLLKCFVANHNNYVNCVVVAPWVHLYIFYNNLPSSIYNCNVFTLQRTTHTQL